MDDADPVALGPGRHPERQPDGAFALAGPEYLRDPADRLPRGLVSASWASAAERQPVAPGRDNLLAWYEAPGAAAADPLRRPSGHRAGRRHDDSAVRARDRPAAGSTGRGSCDVKGSMAAMLVGLCPAGPRTARRARRRCSWPARSTKNSRTPARRAWPRRTMGPSWRSSPSRPRSTSSTATRARCGGRSGPGASPATARRRTWASTPSTGWAGSSTLSRSTPSTLAASTPDPILGPPSLSVGRIEGGQSVNVVPDWCEIEVDRRLIPGEDAAACHARRVETARRRDLRPEADCVEFEPAVGAHAAALRRKPTRWIEPLCSRDRDRDRPPAPGHGRSVRHRRRPA